MSNKEIENPDSYSGQQYLAFERNTEVPVTPENVKIISTPILEARLKKVLYTAFNSREVNEVLDEMHLIEGELKEREKELEEKTKD